MLCVEGGGGKEREGRDRERERGREGEREGERERERERESYKHNTYARKPPNACVTCTVYTADGYSQLPLPKK